MLNNSPDRNFDYDEGRRHSNLSNLEKNCSQMFAKGPAITKEFFEKINTEVVPPKTYFFGYQMNTRRFIVVTGLILLFTFSTMGTITMWFTNTFQKRIESFRVLSEESFNFEYWRVPPPKPRIMFYFFNYTNVKDWEAGKVEKLHVEEVGPYVYYEELERFNVRFSKADGTVSYQEKRTYTFSQELSKGSKDDLLVVPNILLLGGAAVVKNMNFLMRLSYNGLIKALSEKLFKTIRVEDLVNGYNDEFYEVSKGFLKFQDKRIFENFGLLAWKQGFQPDLYTINTGARNINRLGQIEKYNGKSQYDIWRTDSCNSIQGSDGILYPANLIKVKKPVEVFVPQMCRRMSLEYSGESSLFENRIPAYRYKVPLDVYDSVGDKACFCDKETNSCPPRGFFNATICSFGAPFFYSLPHMHNVDPKIQNAVTGQRSNPTDIESFIDIHPNFAMALRAKIRLQLNVRVEKSFGVSELNRFDDGLMLPIVWIDSAVEEKDLNDEMVSLIFHMTFTVKNLELGLKYGCLLAMMVTLTSILLVLKKQRESRHRMDSMRRPISRSEEA
ncbi:unnamed protein product [Ceutorhynchus assimilis]|uniref:Scavenger receptor class B member 1 n=1 Tax=Ceutorhynchus assimilis TaxID=467358 RepID=A0A9N9MQH6_9CUCU|nr:unnamed protein product [Ceutorhynchus assimilis]